MENAADENKISQFILKSNSHNSYLKKLISCIFKCVTFYFILLLYSAFSRPPPSFAVKMTQFTIGHQKIWSYLILGNFSSHRYCSTMWNSSRHLGRHYPIPVTSTTSVCLVSLHPSHKKQKALHFLTCFCLEGNSCLICWGGWASLVSLYFPQQTKQQIKVVTTAAVVAGS